MINFRTSPPGLEISELQNILELLPLAAILYDRNTERILMGNSKASVITAYTIHELSSLSLKHLFPHEFPHGRNNGFLKTERSFFSEIDLDQSTMELVLVTRGEKTISTLVTKHLVIPSKPNLVLMQIKTEAEQIRNILSAKKQQSILMVLQETTELLLTNQDDLIASKSGTTNKILQAWSQLFGAELSVLYLFNGSSPRLYKIKGSDHEAFDTLPSDLPGNDMQFLKQPYVWQPGRRVETTLHHAIRANLVPNFIMTAPLGEQNAPIGFFCLVSEFSPALENAENMLTLLSRLLTIAILKSIREEQQSYEQKKAQYENLFSEITFKNLQEGLVYINPNLSIHKINPAAELIFGFSNEEIVNKPLRQLLDGSPEVERAIIKTINTGQSNSIRKPNLVRRNGKKIQANIHTIPVIDNDTVIRIILIISNEGKLEGLRAQIAQLETLAFYGELIPVFAHDVRNPLNNMSTGIEVLTDILEDNIETHPFLENIQSNIDRLSDLMRMVLSTSKPYEFNKGPIDIVQVLQSLLQTMEHRLEKFGIKPRLNVYSTSQVIQGNHSALQQMFSNIISNALTAMEAQGGLLAILVQDKIENDNNYIEIKISDTGAGIPDEIQNKMFTSAFTTSSKGTGLGLTICKKIITSHQGTIGVESFPGGTVFTIRIPKFVSEGD